ncbi:MAG: hypothetical protein M3R00_06935, partial [Pseudomonadota bacterium]|nr:hypothetical protein [Pseudomonadota bacterium]
GKDNVRNFLKENPVMANEIDALIREKLLTKPTSGSQHVEVAETEEELAE